MVWVSTVEEPGRLNVVSSVVVVVVRSSFSLSTETQLERNAMAPRVSTQVKNFFIKLSAINPQLWLLWFFWFAQSQEQLS